MATMTARAYTNELKHLRKALRVEVDATPERRAILTRAIEVMCGLRANDPAYTAHMLTLRVIDGRLVQGCDAALPAHTVPVYNATTGYDVVPCPICGRA